MYLEVFSQRGNQHNYIYWGGKCCKCYTGEAWTRFPTSCLIGEGDLSPGQSFHYTIVCFVHWLCVKNETRSNLGKGVTSMIEECINVQLTVMHPLKTYKHSRNIINSLYRQRERELRRRKTEWVMRANLKGF